MTEQLFIQLNHNEHDLRWFLLADHELVDRGHAVSFEQIDVDSADQIIALIPDDDVVIRQIKIPGKHNRQRLKAAPFALEEHLASDIDAMHFAFRIIPDSEHILALAIEKQRLEDYLARFSTEGIIVDAMLPASALLDTADEMIAVMALDANDYLVNDGTTRWRADQETTALQLGLVSSKLAEHNLLYWGNQGLPDWLEALSENAHSETIKDGWQSLLNRYESHSPNLLTGDYGKQSNLLELVNLWRKPVIFAAALVVIQLVYQIIQWGYLDYQKSQLQAEITSLYQEVAPGARVVDAKRQMQQLVKQRSGASLNANSFLLLLQGLSKAMADEQGLQLTNINYSQQNQELRLDLIAANLSHFDRLKQQLEASGYSVTMGGATAQGNQYSGRLVIRSQS